MADYCWKHKISHSKHENCPECQKEIDRNNESFNRMRRETEKRKTMGGYCSFCGTKLNSKGDCSRCDDEFGPNFR